MGKRVQYTQITPLPSTVPRQLAIELLHAHREVIELNPLVTGVTAIETPRDAPNDEYFSQWYEIAEVITWGFGMKKKISFRGVFHDLPYGMQSHTYAPMGVDLRIKYRIGGNQPGEPRETRELGVDTPLDGLYLRQDVEIVCNMALASYVKKETKETIGKMIDRLVKKAELLDEGKLHAMFEDGRLKTSKPTAFTDPEGSLNPGSPHGSPSPSMHPAVSPSMQPALATPRLDKNGYGNYHDVARSASQHRPAPYSPTYQPQGYNRSEYGRSATELPGQAGTPTINELPGSYEQPQPSPGLYPDHLKSQGPVFRSELPGDMTFDTGAGTAPSRHSPRQGIAESKPPVQYQSYTPPVEQHPADRASASTTSTAAAPAQQQGVASSPYLQQSRPHSNLVPDHERFSQLSVRQTQNQEHAGPVSSQPFTSDSSNAKCPVCNDFEGDAAAVSHHVSKAHFS